MDSPSVVSDVAASSRPVSIKMPPPSRELTIIHGLILLTLIAACAIQFYFYPRWTAPKFDSQYQAVLLNNGSVFFGKIDKLWTGYPELRDVFYLQQTTNKDTNQPSGVLVKRGKELHEPDHMVINARDIALIEPVGANSRVAQLISQSK